MPKLEKIIFNKLKILKKEYKRTGNDFILSQCLNPKHEDKTPSFSINLESGKSFCFTCGYKLDKNFWIDGVSNFDIDEYEREELYSNIKKYMKKDNENSSYKNILIPPKSGNVRNNYRGISGKLYKELNVYVTKVGKFKGSIIFPIIVSGVILGFESNRFKVKKQKYKHSYGFDAKYFLFGYDYIEKMNKSYIVFTEGIYDAISMLQLGIPATPNWGVADNFSKRKIKKLIELGVETVYLSFDKDDDGINAEKSILENNKELKSFFKVKSGIMLKELQDYYKTNFKDFNDYLRG